ncbi:hypothetical protein Amet_0658 [Alkaliphilus metalliredigens QYMF]|uniref:TRASH domain-containing protein n=1 Tax=Alkaliphilus metalliredigens (strain QYMF) TaxID=293826 RepID=A6TL15_ALKMQ|nr:hypothetical protein [Alkaliphilus metalliredigens]ABR46883.1 hypothetical protein Amet_0658 [Alkaliphilus metalliredigens QYMF]
MDFMMSMVRIMVIFYMVRMIFSAFSRRKNGRAEVEKEKDAAHINRVTEEQQEKTAIETVYDKVCDVYLPKDKAYQVVEQEGTQYFCSWDCRQQYIHQKN